MSNIIWKKPDGSFAITQVSPGVDPETHAQELLDQGAIDTDWEYVDSNVVDLAIYTTPTDAERNTEIKSQILNLESGQARALRETALGIPGGRERLTDIDNQISILRSQLK